MIYLATAFHSGAHFLIYFQCLLAYSTGPTKQGNEKIVTGMIFKAKLVLDVHSEVHVDATRGHATRATYSANKQEREGFPEGHHARPIIGLCRSDLGAEEGIQAQMWAFAALEQTIFEVVFTFSWFVRLHLLNKWIINHGLFVQEGEQYPYDDRLEQEAEVAPNSSTDSASKRLCSEWIVRCRQTALDC
jgi:hypothetical protein